MTRPREQGIVLVAVLFAVTVMSVLVVAATASMRSGISSEQLEQRRLATQLALRSGLESAKALILAASVPERAFLDGTPVPVDLGNGIVAEVGVRDAAGLADLNASDPALIAALLARDLAAGEAAELSSRIAAWCSQAPPAILSVSQ
jgi:type II secretory pathway component PulK